MCEYLNNFNEHAINYEAYSFAKIMSDYFSLNDIQKQELFYILNEIWADKKYLVGNYRYENIIIATCMYTKKESIDVNTIIPDVYKDDYKSHVRQVYAIYTSLQEMFIQL